MLLYMPVFATASRAPTVFIGWATTLAAAPAPEPHRNFSEAVGADGSVKLCYVTFDLGNLHDQRLSEILYTDTHEKAARDAFALNCPGCHCERDERIRKDRTSRALYRSPDPDPRSA